MRCCLFLPYARQSVSLSVCPSRGLNRQRRAQCTPRAVCAGSFGAAFAKRLWPLVKLLTRPIGLQELTANRLYVQQRQWKLNSPSGPYTTVPER